MTFVIWFILMFSLAEIILCANRCFLVFMQSWIGCFCFIRIPACQKFIIVYDKILIIQLKLSLLTRAGFRLTTLMWLPVSYDSYCIKSIFKKGIGCVWINTLALFSCIDILGNNLEFEIYFSAQFKLSCMNNYTFTFEHIDTNVSNCKIQLINFKATEKTK